jgi:hypothetical protein
MDVTALTAEVEALQAQLQAKQAQLKAAALSPVVTTPQPPPPVAPYSASFGRASVAAVLSAPGEGVSLARALALAAHAAG